MRIRVTGWGQIPLENFWIGRKTLKIENRAEVFVLSLVFI